MKKLSIIIVNYNTKDILRDCINNLDGKYPNLELIIVDNSSPDGSADMVGNEFINKGHSWIKLVRSENKGLAHGYNIGVKNATGDYLLFLGSDAFPDESTLTGIVGWMEKEENKKVGIATAKLVLRDGTVDMDAHRGFPYPWAAITHFLFLDRVFPKSRLFNKYFKAYQDLDKPHEIDLCISHFMLVRKQIFNEVGMWDEDYFLYGEDVDLCWRVKQAGWEIYYLPQWEVTHYKGSSIGVRKTSEDVTTASAETKLKMHRQSAKSMKIFYEKNWRQKYPQFLTKLIFFAIYMVEKYRVLRFKVQSQ